MALSLYQATIPSFLQILRATSGLIDKAEDFAASKNLPAADIIQCSFAADMLPFAFQITSACHHSAGAVEGVRNGVFSPRRDMDGDFESLRNRVDGALKTLESVDPSEIDDLPGTKVRFEYGDYKMDYLAEEFLFSFSQPNFYFHATTAYDLLRWKGVTVGKRDFLGVPRTL